MLLYQPHSNASSHTQMKAIESRMEPKILVWSTHMVNFDPAYSSAGLLYL